MSTIDMTEAQMLAQTEAAVIESGSELCKMPPCLASSSVQLNSQSASPSGSRAARRARGWPRT